MMETEDMASTIGAVTQLAFYPAVEFKAEELTPSGFFHGYGAVFNNIDGNGDVIDPGAFTKTLSEARGRKSHRNGPLWPVLWQHKQHEPIGGVYEAEQDTHGLSIIGQLDLNGETGRRAYSALQRGYVGGLSIGYLPVKAAFGRDKKRHLSEIKLDEISVVTFPANREAIVDQLKALYDFVQSRRAVAAVEEPEIDQLEALHLILEIHRQHLDVLRKRS